MKSFYCLALMLGITAVSKAQINSLNQWLAATEKESISTYAFSKKSLSGKEAQQSANLIIPIWKQENKVALSKLWTNKVIEANDLKMKFEYRIFGNKPPGGRSLYISLHGGGNAPASLNDQQFRNQIGLYQPAEGIYIAPRAPWNDWNMWFKPGIDTLYDLLIQAAVAFQDVDPNKVYLMGYSAGGDGVYRIAPRMADRWAASSMMAGHPGDVSMLNLRNLPFMIWVGQLDGAYDRNKWGSVYGAILDSLQKSTPEGYIHETHIVEGKPHWMDRQDSSAVSWMAQYKRNPYPKDIVWKQGDVTHSSFYWVQINSDEAKKGSTLRLNRTGNVITIEESDYAQVTLWLSDDLCNLNEKITVKYKDKVIYNKKATRQLSNMEESWMERRDPAYVFPAKVVVTL